MPAGGGEEGGSFSDLVGGNPSDPFGPAITYTPTPWHRVYEFRINDTGTGWAEDFHLAIPEQPESPAPLLVAMHGANSTHNDIGFNTDYFQQGMDRGWYVVAPLGAHDWNFGVPYAQDNIQVVLDWVMTHFPIDPDRIYGIGFSMGGGAIASYASRHLDPAHARFAAVVNHTGAVSLRDTYDNWPIGLPNYLEDPEMLGGSPDQVPFAYQRISTIDLNGPLFPGAVDPGVDMVRNLVHTAMWTFAVPADPTGYLYDQSVEFHLHLSDIGGDSTLRLGTGFAHGWSTLNEALALNFLDGQVFSDPPHSTWVRTLADRDARWYHFTITQADPGQFTPFRWRTDPIANQVTLDHTANLASVRFDPVDAGLVPSQLVRVALGPTPDPFEVVVDGYPEQPATVLRGGVLAEWSYDPQAGSIRFVEPDGEGYPVWTIFP